MKDKEYNHPAYGVIRVSRVSGFQPCFMNEGVRTEGYITITVKQGSLSRHLSNYWVHGDDTVLELRMTYSQYAEMISNPNFGDGVPCTLEYITPKGSGRVETFSPPPSPKSEFEAELKTHLDGSLTKLTETEALIRELLEKGKANKAELSQLLKKVGGAKSEICSNIPFVEEQFQEAMGRATDKSKVELASWMDHQLTVRGLEASKEDLKLLEGD